MFFSHSSDLSKPPSHEVLDLERREPTLNQPPHQTITTGFDVFGREIPPSEEDMPEIASHQPESHDEGQSVVGPCSPTDSLASGSRRLRELQISENTHGRSTPRTPTPPIVARAQEDTSQKPQTAQVVGSSELCAACPIVDIRELPSQCEYHMCVHSYIYQWLLEIVCDNACVWPLLKLDHWKKYATEEKFRMVDLLCM